MTTRAHRGRRCCCRNTPSKERTEYTWLNLNRRVRHQISVTPERSGLCLLRRFTIGSPRTPCRTTEGLNSVHTDSARSPRTANSLAHVYPYGPTTIGKKPMIRTVTQDRLQSSLEIAKRSRAVPAWFCPHGFMKRAMTNGDSTEIESQHRHLRQQKHQYRDRVEDKLFKKVCYS